MKSITIEETVLINDYEFLKLKELIYNFSGIFIEKDKKEFIQNKLNSHLHLLHFDSFTKYFYYLLKTPEELQIMINKITTNQTYFFREQKHYDFLEEILKKLESKRVFNCWSAASSSGEEAYSCAMLIGNVLNKSSHRWEVVLSDINNEMLDKAKQAKYILSEAKKIPENFFNLYCNFDKNTDKHHFYIKSNLKRQMQFKLINLTHKLPKDLEEFDVIFLRNIIIYFDKPTRKKVVENVIEKLKKNGYLFMGHSESLFNITSKVRLIEPSIYQKV